MDTTGTQSGHVPAVHESGRNVPADDVEIWPSWDRQCRFWADVTTFKTPISGTVRGHSSDNSLSCTSEVRLNR